MSLLCPHCGQPMGDFSGLDLSVFSPTQRLILEALAEARSRNTPTTALVQKVYAHRADGGPDGAVHCVKNQIGYMKKKLATQGWKIISAYGEGYRLVKMEAAE